MGKLRVLLLSIGAVFLLISPLLFVSIEAGETPEMFADPAPITWVAPPQEEAVPSAPEQMEPPDADHESLTARIELLHRALAAETPEEAVSLYVKGLQTRNGALELAAMAPELRQKKEKPYKHMRWVTGTSSPWIEQVRISRGEENPDGSFTYRIQLYWRTSTEPEQPDNWSAIPYFSVEVSEVDGHWYVTDLPGKPKHVQFRLPDGRTLDDAAGLTEWEGNDLQVMTLGFGYNGSYRHTQSLFGNHSEVLHEEDVAIGEHRATLALVERTPPAAADSEESSWEYWLFVVEPQVDHPEAGFAYTLILYAGEDLETARRLALEIGETLRLTPWNEYEEE